MINSNHLNSIRRSIKTSHINFIEKNLNMLIKNLFLTSLSAHIKQNKKIAKFIKFLFLELETLTSGKETLVHYCLKRLFYKAIPLL